MTAPRSISLLNGQFKETQVVEDTLVGVVNGVEIRLDNEMTPIDIIQTLEILKRYYQQFIAKEHPN